MSKQQERQQEALMEHEEAMQLHKANLQGTSRDKNGDRARLLDTVIESDLEATDDALANLRAKDFPLSNFDEGEDTVEFKWMQEILDIFTKARYPHPDSGLQGLARAWATGNMRNRRQALRLDEFAKDESFKLGTYSRAKRGEDMAQQETSAKQVTETHAVRENGSSSNGGIRGWLRNR
jgi:hypothetical protein